MNILIPNSWLKDYLDTNATPQEFADAMSLTSVSIERIDKVDDDFVYDIEVTTNRPDLMSVEGIAREASAVLPLQGQKAIFKKKKNEGGYKTVAQSPLLKIESDSKLVNRILAVVMEVELKPSPEIITKRLERTGIRSINNVVDTTNYIMREVGHPAHVFDYDRLLNHTLIIRKSKKGEKLTTLDDKEYVLSGDDIVADNGKGDIVDLLGIMGTANSVVTPQTKRIVLFLDNNNPHMLRKTSMELGIRTEAAVLNEKGVDPELMLPTIIRGIELLKKNANGKLLTPIIDIYPNKPKKKSVKVTQKQLDNTIGLTIPKETVTQILTHLGFGVKVLDGTFTVEVPSIRNNDIEIPEDIVEEVARVSGYFNIPNRLPIFPEQAYYHQDKNEFYWIQKIKQAFLYWGYNEVYTYSMVSEELFDGPVEQAVRLKNPLTEDRSYLRNSLTPSILEVVRENKNRTSFKLFEVANVYHKKSGLPDEILHISGVLAGEGVDFYDCKGVIEQLFSVLGIESYKFAKSDEGVGGAMISVSGKNVGDIEVLDEITFELNLSEILKNVSARKVYKPAAKFPPIIEDMRVEIEPHHTFQQIESELKKVSELITEVSILDVYRDKKTFRITYQSPSRNLRNEDVVPVREEIQRVFEEKFGAALS